MRKNCFRLLSLTVLAVAVTSISAFAADASIQTNPSRDDVTLAANGTDKVDVAYNSAESDKEYLIMVQSEDGTPTETNLVYIDQTTAGTTSVSFTVNPKELTSGKTYYVYLSSNSEATGGIRERVKVGTFEYKAGTSEYTPGNVDGDTSITATDAQWTLQAAVGNRTLDDEQKLAANVDGDANITATDAQWILQAAVGNRTL